MTRSLNVVDVIAGLRTIDVLDTFGAKYTDRAQIRLTECPRCRQRSHRGAIVIDRESGAWIHHGGVGVEDAICKGDVLDLVAGFAGIDRKTEFRRLLETAAPIAGVTSDVDHGELFRRREERQRAAEEYARTEAEKRARAHAEVPSRWAALDRRSLVGERYLQGRGIQTTELVARDIVRFAENGDPSVRLFDFETGAPINILRRQVDRDPKVLALSGCSTDGTIIGKVSDVDPDGVDVAVLVEGVTDSLAAVTAFAGCAIVGANGASRLASVAKAVAPRIAAARGWLLVVPDVDGGVGEAHAADAVIAAETVGLELDRNIFLVDVRPYQDLADGVRAGWRWGWPQ